MLRPLHLLLVLPALAQAPPSTVLTGATGTLSWTVSTTPSGIVIEGRSPEWTVHHEATADLVPARTVRTDAKGNTVTVDYTGAGATVALPNETIQHDEAGLWDSDTLDIRLGAHAARGWPGDLEFRALDPSTGKLYSFEAEKLGDEDCGGTPCRHVELQLAGWLGAVAPDWNYWFHSNGQLLRFEGPMGAFQAW